MFKFKVFQELAFYSHATFKAHLLGLLGQHIFSFQVFMTILFIFSSVYDIIRRRRAQLACVIIAFSYVFIHDHSVF